MVERQQQRRVVLRGAQRRDDHFAHVPLAHGQDREIPVVLLRARKARDPVGAARHLQHAVGYEAVLQIGHGALAQREQDLAEQLLQLIAGFAQRAHQMRQHTGVGEILRMLCPSLLEDRDAPVAEAVQRGEQGLQLAERDARIGALAGAEGGKLAGNVRACIFDLRRVDHIEQIERPSGARVFVCRQQRAGGEQNAPGCGIVRGGKALHRALQAPVAKGCVHAEDGGVQQAVF